MANWQRTLKLQPETDQASAGEISVQELAAVVAKRLRALRPFGDEYIDNERDEIADEFEWIARSSDAESDDYDEVLDRLYDWGDIHISGDFFNAKKVCWVDCFPVTSS